MDTLADSWREFRKKALPMDSPDLFIMLQKRAFYTGAYTLFDLLFKLEPGLEPTIQDIIKVEALYQEIIDFRNEVAEGHQ